MKIEMGESLVLSWLRHIEKCQLVQLNWKVSNCWEGYNSEEVKTLYENIKIHFPVFKNNSNLEQLIKQAELDALGVSFNNNNCEYHAVDIAYHENGLNYGSTQETIERIQKKLLRSALVLYMQFNIKTGKIYFLSPKINPVVIFDLKEKIGQVESYMKNNGFNFEFVVIANSDFKSKILTPLLDKLNCIADTSELFMRSIQLLNVCNNYETNENTVCNNETLINKKHAKIFSGQKHKGYQKEKIEDETKNALYLIAYCFSRYEHTSIFPNHGQDVSFEIASEKLGVKKTTLRNNRDKFDGHNESSRRGWWQTPLPDDMEKVKRIFDSKTKQELITEAKEILGMKY